MSPSVRDQMPRLLLCTIRSTPIHLLYCALLICPLLTTASGQHVTGCYATRHPSLCFDSFSAGLQETAGSYCSKANQLHATHTESWIATEHATSLIRIEESAIFSMPCTARISCSVWYQTSHWRLWQPTKTPHTNGHTYLCSKANALPFKRLSSRQS